MPNNQRLELRQSQALVMTPQLQQSIKFLQLSTIELSNYLSQELEKNPLLAKEEGMEESLEPASNDDNDEEALTHAEKTSEVEDVTSDMETTSYEEGATFSEGWEPDSRALYDGAPSQRFEGAGRQYATQNDFAWENNTAEDVTLKHYIADQIAIEIQDHQQQMIALHLADVLEDSGYLTADLNVLAENLGCTLSDVEAVVALVQRLDPPGVFARSVEECLALQLKDKNRYDPIIATLLSRLDLLAKGEIKTLQKLCQVTEEELLEMVKEIKQLNPKPGSNFSAETIQVIQPDVFLKRDGNGNWVVELNSDALPKLLVNKRYHAEILEKAASETDRKYLTEQLNSANWLIKALDQRANTILKVATEIAIQQRDFFEKGIRFLKPLTLAGIAQILGVHESTVSRVTANKYLATPLGVYEMKYFFSSSIQNAAGEEEFSSKSIQFLIAEMIRNEKAGSVLSDDKIAILLKQRGIDIARRTVAKYREAANIPPSSQRKREKRLGE